ncbi:MAG: hypothetical protein J7J52_04770 [Deltaproteobacteria bacterium]|nr:hypothetical protein [Deltaproteobacteria bacterium]
MKSKFYIEKECKHSRRYRTKDESFPIRTIYVERSFSEGLDALTLILQKEESHEDRSA